MMMMSKQWCVLILLLIASLLFSSWANNDELYSFHKSSDSNHLQAITTDDTKISKTNSLWTDCSKSSDPMTIYSINISPSPLQRGNTVYAVMTAGLKQSINGGKISIIMRYGSAMTVVRKRYKLCKFIKKNGLSCPLSAGTVNFTYSIDIPSSIPTGQYTGSIVAIDENSDEIACVSLNLNMGA